MSKHPLASFSFPSCIPISTEVSCGIGEGRLDRLEGGSYAAAGISPVGFSAQTTDSESILLTVPVKLSCNTNPAAVCLPLLVSTVIVSSSMCSIELSLQGVLWKSFFSPNLTSRRAQSDDCLVSISSVDALSLKARPEIMGFFKIDKIS
nr:hypothetical protein Iba_scaffold13902CG0010 [Ipomoea batatas]